MSSHNQWRRRAFWGFLELTLNSQERRSELQNELHELLPYFCSDVRVYTMDSSKGIRIRLLFFVLSFFASYFSCWGLSFREFSWQCKIFDKSFFFSCFFWFDLTIEGSRTWNMTIQVIFGHLKSAILRRGLLLCTGHNHQRGGGKQGLGFKVHKT